MPQTNLEVATPDASMFVKQKMTYEEFLREYDGQSAEYVDGEIIKTMSVTERYDDLTRFLQALLRFLLKPKILVEYAVNLIK